MLQSGLICGVHGEPKHEKETGLTGHRLVAGVASLPAYLSNKYDKQASMKEHCRRALHGAVLTLIRAYSQKKCHPMLSPYLSALLSFDLAKRTACSVPRLPDTNDLKSACDCFFYGTYSPSSIFVSFSIPNYCR
jgi:hypothetical protein